MEESEESERKMRIRSLEAALGAERRRIADAEQALRMLKSTQMSDTALTSGMASSSFRSQPSVVTWITQNVKRGVDAAGIQHGAIRGSQPSGERSTRSTEHGGPSLEGGPVQLLASLPEPRAHETDEGVLDASVLRLLKDHESHVWCTAFHPGE